MTYKVNPSLLRLGVIDPHPNNLFMDKKLGDSQFWLYFFEFLKTNISFLFYRAVNKKKSIRKNKKNSSISKKFRSQKQVDRRFNIRYRNNFNFNRASIIDILFNNKHASMYTSVEDVTLRQSTHDFYIDVYIFHEYRKKINWPLIENYLQTEINELINQSQFFLITGIEYQFKLTCHIVEQPYSSTKIQLYRMKREFEERKPKRLRFILNKAFLRSKELDLPGMKIRLTGRLDGAERAKTLYREDGRVALRTYTTVVDYACGFAKTKFGVLGIKIWIDQGISGDFHQSLVSDNKNRMYFYKDYNSCNLHYIYNLYFGDAIDMFVFVYDYIDGIYSISEFESLRTAKPEELLPTLFY
uniref:ribosomal protein S3 n=1 Tax=Prototheca tumulicola TaxID=1737639 RepID=UPI003001B29D